MKITFENSCHVERIIINEMIAEMKICQNNIDSKYLDIKSAFLNKVLRKIIKVELKFEILLIRQQFDLFYLGAAQIG